MAAAGDPAWTARRALFEGAEASVELIAAASRVRPDRLEARAQREGWIAKGSAGGDFARRLRRMRDLAVKLIEKMEIWDEAGGAPDRASLAELSAVLRTLEKLGDGTRDDERAKENQARRNADIAGILKRLDDRVVELATELATELAAQKVQ